MSRNVLVNVFMIAVGAAAGSLVTWKLMDEKYKRIADDEIESMREYFEEKYRGGYEQMTLDDVLNEEPEKDTEVEQCEAIVEELGYVDYKNIVKPNKEVDEVSIPYVIPPEDFTEIPDYKVRSLTYFSDGVLTDNQYTPIEDVDDVVGLDSLDHFGDYEDDAVHVRNDRLKTDFEIILVPEKYADFINNGPYLLEDE